MGTMIRASLARYGRRVSRDSFRKAGLPSSELLAASPSSTSVSNNPFRPQQQRASSTLNQYGITPHGRTLFGALGSTTPDNWGLTVRTTGGRREGMAAVGYCGVGARRNFWSRGRKGSKDDPPSTTESNTEGGFSETGAGGGGDEWKSPPDSWNPEPDAIAQQADSGRANSTQDAVNGAFDAPGAFVENSDVLSSVDAVSGSMSAVSDVVAATTTLSPADLGMWPSHMFMHLIENVQATLGVPYWEAIVLTTVAVRLLVMPLVVVGTRNSLRMSMATPEMEPIQQKMKEIHRRGSVNPEDREAGKMEMNALKLEMEAIFRKHNVKLSRTMYMFAQAPIFISLFFATKEMGVYFTGYATGGLSWAADLGVSDPSYYLPIITWATMQALVEMGTGMPQPAGKLPFNMQHLMRAMGIMTVPISLTMPAGVLVYWTTSNVVGMLQRVFMDSVAVRRALDIPLVSDLPHSRQSPPTGPSEPQEAEFTSKEDLDRWSGGGTGEARDNIQRTRDEVARVSKARHDALKREHEAKVGGQENKTENQK